MADEADKIPTIIRVLSAYRDLSMSRLAARIGISSQVMSNRMNGRAVFSFEELKAIAAALDVEPTVWFDEPENALKYVRTGSRSTPATAEVQPLPRPVAGDEGLAVAI